MHDFLRRASSLPEAVEQYCSFHDRVTSVAQLPGDLRYLIYTPSFHGEGALLPTVCACGHAAGAAMDS